MVEDGYRESAESWKTVLRDLKRRGMRPPVVAVGDGALGFWAAVRDVWSNTREQRDWFHDHTQAVPWIGKPGSLSGFGGIVLGCGGRPAMRANGRPK
jgi:putative transposase